jgi:excisionase family DNA binding protein
VERLLLTVPQVMSELGFSRWRVYELIRTRELASVKVGRSRRIPRVAVEEFVGRLISEAAW